MELQGPGTIVGTGSTVLYNIPDTIEGESTQATIMGTVTDEAGQETTETFTFNILASKIPAPEPAKKGMSTEKKVVIGVVVVTLIVAIVLFLKNFTYYPGPEGLTSKT